MRNLLDAADKGGPYQIVAVSDVYAPHCDVVKERSNGVATTHLDYREVLAQDIDAVSSLLRTTGTFAWQSMPWRPAKTSTWRSLSPTRLRKGATLTRAVRSGKQILQCGMQQRSWTHFRDAVNMIQGGSLGRITQVRTYWWQNYNRNWVPKPIDAQALDGSFGSDPLRTSPSARKKYNHWRWFWNFGRRRHDRSLLSLDRCSPLGHESDQAREVHMLGDKSVFDQWDCPDTIQAAFRYPGF